MAEKSTGLESRIMSFLESNGGVVEYHQIVGMCSPADYRGLRRVLKRLRVSGELFVQVSVFDGKKSHLYSTSPFGTVGGE